MARSFADEMTIDETTGLPALPEGYAWRVTRTGETLFLQLVKRYVEVLDFWDKLFRKTPEVSWNEHYLEGGGRIWDKVEDQTKEGILESATSLYAEVRAHATTAKELDELVGLYPPKTIL